jgi:DNA-binding CsgD family transcriptional regulator
MTEVPRVDDVTASPLRASVSERTFSRMGRLHQRDLRRALLFLADARIGSTTDPIPRPMLVGLRDLAGAAEAEYFELRVGDRGTVALSTSQDFVSAPGTEEAMTRFADQNPLRWRLGAPGDGPQRLSARIRARDLWRTAWYQEFMRPNHLTDILKVWLWRSPATIACIQLWRHDGTFSRRDQDMLGVLQHDLMRLRAVALGTELAADHPGVGLTAREAEVLLWAMRGHPRDAIAARLGLASRTVGKHLERAYEELGVRSRAEAVDRLLLSGPMDGPPEGARDVS